MKVANRTFVVSGGASGLGLATVRELIDAGAYAVILDRATPLEDLDSNRVLFIRTDITRVDEVERAVSDAVAWTKRTGGLLGGVINCAGIGLSESLVDGRGQVHSLENWQRHIAVNLTGVFNVTRFVLKHLVRVPPEEGADGERGVVILVSSTAAHEGMPGTIAYAASKGAIRSMTLPMARDCAQFGVRVVTIVPGPFTTPLTGGWAPKVTNGMMRKGLLFPNRYGEPREFVQTVRWVLDCAYVNGENIKLTGGGRLPARM
ncbi:3-hydroxy-acyl-CoA-dehydrogenase [Roridomyces roridus]|uniref:3-hydroxy-acyl-CoA-dehydrogenase n=1 Tax=Roridomyces roridus TaxID=1738132 RepID=A0AAD7BKM6_9AGAR|nr:3-hydroxy-acyl-CoA-dehydrogenase [Roridomyces roridus]